MTDAADQRRRAERALANAEKALRDTKTSSLDVHGLKRLQDRIDEVERQLALMKEAAPAIRQLSSCLLDSQSHMDDKFFVRYRRKAYVRKLEGQEVRELGRRTRRLERAIIRAQHR